VGCQIKCNASDNERVNKMLGIIGDRCPSSGNACKSATVGLKHYLGAALNISEQPQKTALTWDRRRPFAKAMLSTCLQHVDSAKEVMSQPGRFKSSSVPASVPSPETVAELLPYVDPTFKRNNRALAWAAAFHTLWSRRNRDLCGAGFGCIQHCWIVGGEARLCANHVRSCGHFVKVHLIEGGGVAIVRPLTIASSLHVFRSWFDRLRPESGEQLEISIEEIRIVWDRFDCDTACRVVSIDLTTALLVPFKLRAVVVRKAKPTKPSSSPSSTEMPAPIVSDGADAVIAADRAADAALAGELDADDLDSPDVQSAALQDLVDADGAALDDTHDPEVEHMITESGQSIHAQFVLAKTKKASQ
jgi:hypothetical protein